jgi:hypothetical protein
VPPRVAGEGHMARGTCAEKAAEGRKEGVVRWGRELLAVRKVNMKGKKKKEKRNPQLTKAPDARVSQRGGWWRAYKYNVKHEEKKSDS